MFTVIPIIGLRSLLQISTNVLLEQVDAVKTASTLMVHLRAAVEVDTSWQAMEKAAMVIPPSQAA